MSSSNNPVEIEKIRKKMGKDGAFLPKIDDRKIVVLPKSGTRYHKNLDGSLKRIDD